MESTNHHFNQFVSNSFTELCFDRSEFNRTDFNVDAFLAKARRRGISLEQIRDDARVYLKIIQNSMIELINKDYADFVHLSSNLAGLRGAVEKLGTEADEMVSEFEQTATKIKSVVNELTKESEEKRRISTEQRMLDSRIVALTTLERLKHFSSSPRFSLSYDDVENDCECIRRACYMIDELQAIRNYCQTTKMELHPKFEKAFTSVLDSLQTWLESKLIYSVQNSHRLLLVYALRGFTACDRLDCAQAIFLAQFIDPDLRKYFTDSKKQKIGKLDQFKYLLDQVLAIRKRYWPLFVVDSDNAGQNTAAKFLDQTACKIVSNFLDDCLLTALLSQLQDRFSSVLIPTDAAVFRKAYQLLVAFAGEWTKTGASNKILKMIFDKFSLAVYYQLCYHETTSAVDANMASLNELLPAVESTNSKKFSLKFTFFIYDQLITIWSSDDSLFLPPLLPKFLELTLMTINRYGRRILDAVGDFQKASENDVTGNQSMKNGDGYMVPKRPSSAALSTGISTSPDASILILYYSDLRNLQCQALDDLLPKILTQSGIEDVEVNRRLEQCLIGTFKTLVQEIGRSITDALIPCLSSQISAQLSSVIEVPRQYRWTRKEAPSQPSSYLSNSFDPIRSLLDVASREMPADQSLVMGILDRVLVNVLSSYTSNLKTVVDSVEKISSSLSRLKTKGGSDGSGRAGNVQEGAVTDEQKIRMQLRLDVEEFERIVDTFHLPFHCDFTKLKALVTRSDAAQES